MGELKIFFKGPNLTYKAFYFGKGIISLRKDFLFLYGLLGPLYSMIDYSLLSWSFSTRVLSGLVKKNVIIEPYVVQ